MILEVSVDRDGIKRWFQPMLEYKYRCLHSLDGKDLQYLSVALASLIVVKAYKEGETS